MNTNKEELEKHRKLMIDVVNAASKKSNKELIKDSSSDIGSPTQVIAYAELISRAQTELLDIANRACHHI